MLDFFCCRSCEKTIYEVVILYELLQFDLYEIAMRVFHKRRYFEECV